MLIIITTKINCIACVQLDNQQIKTFPINLHNCHRHSSGTHAGLLWSCGREKYVFTSEIDEGSSLDVRDPSLPQTSEAILAPHEGERVPSVFIPALQTESIKSFFNCYIQKHEQNIHLTDITIQWNLIGIAINSNFFIGHQLNNQWNIAIISETWFDSFYVCVSTMMAI